MATKDKSESENFDKVMDGLLSVPYSELQKKLEEEKREKTKRKVSRKITKSGEKGK